MVKKKSRYIIKIVPDIRQIRAISHNNVTISIISHFCFVKQLEDGKTVKCTRLGTVVVVPYWG